MRITRPRATKLSQITIDGDFNLGGYALKFTDVLVKQLTADSVGIRNIGDTLDKNIQGLYVIGSNRVQTDLVSELTEAHGVEVDGVDLKDNKIAILGLPTISSKYLLGGATIIAHNAEANNKATSFTKMKTITITDLFFSPETIRIYVEHKCDAGGTAHTRIYKNGVAVGVDETTVSVTFVQISEDLVFADGDDIEIYGYNNATYAVFIQNFRVQGGVTDITYREAVNKGRTGISPAITGTISTP